MTQHTLRNMIIPILLCCVISSAFASGAPASYTPYRLVTPCNKHGDICATLWSNQLTGNYRYGVALNRFPNPTDVCYVSSEACTTLRNDWNSRIKVGVQEKAFAYSPGPRPWLNKTCKTVYQMGVSRIICT